MKQVKTQMERENYRAHRLRPLVYPGDVVHVATHTFLNTSP